MRGNGQWTLSPLALILSTLGRCDVKAWSVVSDSVHPRPWHKHQAPQQHIHRNEASCVSSDPARQSALSSQLPLSSRPLGLARPGLPPCTAIPKSQDD